MEDNQDEMEDNEYEKEDIEYEMDDDEESAASDNLTGASRSKDTWSDIEFNNDSAGDESGDGDSVKSEDVELNEPYELDEFGKHLSARKVL